jgi:hypothetical protein
MPRFRIRKPSSISGPVTCASVRPLIAEMVRASHFFLGPGLALKWECVADQELSWEIFQGRLLDPAHTRRRRSFAAWKVYAANPAAEEPPGEPLLALYFDEEAGELHVVRGLDSYVWEGYDAGGNVYLSRERRKWIRELVASLRLDRFADAEELRDELACVLFQAVVGTSRLPLSSIETPLPAFSFGQLFYCYRPDAPENSGSVRGWRCLLTDMLRPALNPREEAHLLETFLHAMPPSPPTPLPSGERGEATPSPPTPLPSGERGVDLSPLSPLGRGVGGEGDAAEAFVGRWTQCGRTAAELPVLLRTLFNEVSLSPYTDLVAKTLAFVHALEQSGIFRTEKAVDFLSYLLRHVGRHLTAFDLVVFHHRGANYPDALLLDAVLKEYRTILDRRPDLFLDAAGERDSERRPKRIRRRGLRQAWLLRRRYEGHAVPDLPTSPGENMRVLPPSHPRVPEEQIAQPARRTRHLYDEDSLLPQLSGKLTEILRQSFRDLEHAEEWRELGLGVFLDRPLSVAKAAAEPDGTLLLSAEAFSAAIARERLLALAGDIGANPEDPLVQRLLAHPPLPGLPLDAIGGAVRPDTVSLADARRAAADFVFLRSTPSSVRAFVAQFDFTPLAQQFPIDDLLGGADVLIARSSTSAGLVFYDSRRRPRVELEVATEKGFESRAGQEYPIGGLRVLRVWELETIHDLRSRPIILPPRS